MGCEEKLRLAARRAIGTLSETRNFDKAARQKAYFFTLTTFRIATRSAQQTPFSKFQHRSTIRTIR